MAEALKQADNLREVLEEVFPHLVDHFDFDRMELVPTKFLIEDWRGRESDLLFHIPFRMDDGTERWIIVCILLEHQSSHDARMPLRVLLYSVLYWEREWKSWEAADRPRDSLRLTPVLPIVFHTGGEPWLQNRQLWDLIDAPPELLQLVTTWKPLFWDLADRSIDELLRQGRDWLRTLAVVRAEREDPESFQRVFTEVLHRLERMEPRQSIRWHDLVRFVISWGFQRRRREEQAELRQLAEGSQRARTRRTKVRKMTETVADWLRSEGRKQGEKEGRKQGEKEGRKAKFMLIEDRFSKQ